jgi:hypothetical protein
MPPCFLLSSRGLVFELFSNDRDYGHAYGHDHIPRRGLDAPPTSGHLHTCNLN